MLLLKLKSLLFVNTVSTNPKTTPCFYHYLSSVLTEFKNQGTSIQRIDLVINFPFKLRFIMPHLQWRRWMRYRLEKYGMNNGSDSELG